MSKRSSYQIKKDILILIKEKPATYAQLERKVNTGFATIKANCEELESFGNVKVDKKKRHGSNGRPYFEVNITKQGRDFIKQNT